MGKRNRSTGRWNNLPRTMQKVCNSAGCRAGVSDSAACTTVPVMPSVALNHELSTVLKIKCTNCVFCKSVCCYGALIYWDLFFSTALSTSSKRCSIQFHAGVLKPGYFNGVLRFLAKSDHFLPNCKINEFRLGFPSVSANYCPSTEDTCERNNFWITFDFTCQK